MSWEAPNNPPPTPPPHQDRFHDRGGEMIHCLYSAAIDHLNAQPPGEAERFAVALHDQGIALMSKHAESVSRCELHPLALGPELRPSASLQTIPGRKRAMTGIEAAEARERNAIYTRQRVE